ncbi:sulfatase [Methylobacterium sp. Leaf456]|uniref:LTA synthase family protein n=1 Tax=Methylobacterium sp. Leaf456 TaxID=1736382 RepID=UPI0006FC7D5A|nr:LTA synthase family protein [Methylobacterium sp. Leaf456]KQT45449.1 sulfatase [Methylobacterium sp. Leaf456]
MTLLVPLALALASAFAVEAASAGRRPSLHPADLAVRGLGYALLTAFWFQFSWRPWLAAASCLLTVAILAAVDRLKRRIIGEPPVFSDLALLAQVPRHPELYYTRSLADPRASVPLLLGFGMVAAWYALEPTALPGGTSPALAAVAALPVGLAALVGLLRTPPGRALVRRLFPRPDLAADVARFGVVATMMGYALRRRDEVFFEIAPPAPVLPPGEPEAEIIVVVQLESFLDPTRIGGPPLPVMDRIRTEAAQYGRLAVPAHGAYTMRTEHAVLTGREPESLGFGRYDPYLAAKGDEPTSLARLARSKGFATAFVHPFHRDFFDRARVFGRLGFDRLVMEEEFSEAPRIGPYVADEAVAERILSEVAGEGRRFVFAVTMENHGPWTAGRLPGIEAGLAQYAHHAAGTGRAVERLIDGLKGRRATLCVFGDHAPSLPECRPRPDGPVTTDYAVFRFPAVPAEPPPPRTPPHQGEGTGAGSVIHRGTERREAESLADPELRRVDLTAAQLGCLLRDALAANRPGLKGQA